MSTIEGGMVCTDDDSLAEMLKIVRANGWDRNLNEHQKKKWRSGLISSRHFRPAILFMI
jgi:CDP-6-deoxy-D-xylo-4-hexulose-3-dehydrase